MPDNKPWWQNAVIYQIYPRSFFDSNGDGIGDLHGIEQKLDYVVSLEVDAIWVSPFYPSPMDDFGYDITDFCAVDPMFGSLYDFQNLLQQAHKRGLKVLMDQVWCHTSYLHPWFQESMKSRVNAKADWYVWADADKNGDPPNNWQATFGGPAWSWHPLRQQYYLHHFLEEQPALNWYNPDVEKMMLDVGRFWLDMGVDGFRFDVVNFLKHDPALRNNPPRRDSDTLPAGGTLRMPFFHFRNQFNIGQQATWDALAKIRAMMDEYPDTTSLAEISSAEDALHDSLQAVSEGRLRMAYNSSLMTEHPLTAAQLRQTIRDAAPLIERGGLCWTAGTHDFPRLSSRWHQHLMSDRFDQAVFNYLLAALLVSLPGSTCLYQGDELGLPEAELTREQLRDPFGIRNYPEVAGRDGCRTPIPWHEKSLNFGFSHGDSPWLPLPQAHGPFSVEKQLADRDSLLNKYRKLLCWRRQVPALNDSLAIEMVDTDHEVLGFIRGRDTSQPILFLFNFSDESIHQGIAGEWQVCADLDPSFGQFRRLGNVVELPPHGVYIAQPGVQQAKGVNSAVHSNSSALSM